MTLGLLTTDKKISYQIPRKNLQTELEVIDQVDTIQEVAKKNKAPKRRKFRCYLTGSIEITILKWSKLHNSSNNETKIR